MLAKFETVNYDNSAGVWTAKYLNLKNVVHWHNENEIIYINSGSAEIGVNNRLFKGCCGDTFFCANGDMHYITSSPGSIISIILTNPKTTRSITDNYSLSSPKLSQSYKTSLLFDWILDELNQKNPFYKEKIHSMIKSYTADVFRKEPLSVASAKHNITLAAYRELISYIDKNYSDICFSDAANKMGFTSSHFSKVFERLSGTTFTKYLNYVKIEKSIDMLKKSQRTITDIATSCGFNSSRHFNRVFKELTGITPKNLPADFVFSSIPVKTYNKLFNPTADGSVLL